MKREIIKQNGQYILPNEENLAKRRPLFPARLSLWNGLHGGNNDGGIWRALIRYFPRHYKTTS